MDEKTLQTLEYPKILDRLAGYCAFSASAGLARALQPTADLVQARLLQAETTEARRLLAARPETTVGGARDVRPLVEAAARNAVLTPGELLEIKATLVSARNLGRALARLESEFPRLAGVASRLPAATGLVDAISQAISERAEVLDSASERLSTIRKELRIAHERLLDRMQRMLTDGRIAPYLQEALVTQRDGRYVLPLRAEFKGRVRAVVHDQSASGATLFVEPLAVVELNNRYRELQLDERDEERRVLMDLSNRVGEHAPAVTGVVAILAELDLAFARARYAGDLAAAEPALQPFRPRKGSRHPGGTLRLWQARHPLLDPDAVVPIDVELDPETYALVITGPNTGGKTVTLKTVGLLALMAQSGLHIPAQPGSELSAFGAVYADIGDEQSIEQSLSTFSGHITNIIRILEQAGKDALVILDELGAGTDPQEGSALARAILTRLLERSVTTLVATHYPELKAYAHSTAGVVNASVEFDLETLTPTFHLTLGLPGRSNALAIAQRLGLPQDIIDAARADIHPSDLRAEDLLEEIHRQRDQAIAAREAVEQARREADALSAELAGRLADLEDERRAVLEAAREEARGQLADLQAELAGLRRELSRARQPLETVEAVEDRVASLEEDLAEPVATVLPEVPPAVEDRDLRLGDRVHLPSLEAQGVVTALGEEDAEVQVGMLRVRARRAELQLVAEPEEQATETQAADRPPTATEIRHTGSGARPGVELDLRGQTVDEALDAVDRYLDSAYLAGLPFVRLIHGKGTGRLREAVRRELARHPQVDSFQPGLPNEGGEGVTVARLKRM